MDEMEIRHAWKWQIGARGLGSASKKWTSCADFSSIISANLCIYGELLTLGAYDWRDEGSSNLLNANFLWRKRWLMYS
jgi:hypothetical protein